MTAVPPGATCFDGAGDPSAAIDTSTGVLYMGSLGFFFGLNPIPAGHTNDNGVFVFRSTDHGQHWSQTNVYVDASATRTNDKDWITVDNGATSPKHGSLYAVWARFGEGSSPFGGGGSPIRLANSSNGGVTWHVYPTPVSAQPTSGTPLCTTPGLNATDACPDNQFADVRVGRDGTIYVTWINYDTPDQSQIIFERSINPITGLYSPVHLVSNVQNPVFEITDFLGNGIGGLQDQRERINTYPKLAVDASGATSPNALYVVYEAFPTVDDYSNLGPIGANFDNSVPSDCSPTTIGVRGIPTVFNCLGRGSHIYMNVSLDGGMTWVGMNTPQFDGLTGSAGRIDSVIGLAAFFTDRFNPSVVVDPNPKHNAGAPVVIWYDARDDWQSVLTGFCGSGFLTTIIKNITTSSTSTLSTIISHCVNDELSFHNKLLDVEFRNSTGPATIAGGKAFVPWTTTEYPIQALIIPIRPLINLDEDTQRLGRGNFAGDYIQVAANNGAVFAHWTDTRFAKDGFQQEDNVLEFVNLFPILGHLTVFNNDTTPLDQNEETVAVGFPTGGKCDVLGGYNDYRYSFGVDGVGFKGIGTGFSVWSGTGDCRTAFDDPPFSPPVNGQSNTLFPYDPLTAAPMPFTITVNLHLFSYKTVNVLVQVCTTPSCTTVTTSTSLTLSPGSPVATRVFTLATGTYNVRISGYSIVTQTSAAITVPPGGTANFSIL
jgi:hypothetical protein